MEAAAVQDGLRDKVARLEQAEATRQREMQVPSRVHPDPPSSPSSVSPAKILLYFCPPPPPLPPSIRSDLPARTHTAGTARRQELLYVLEGCREEGQRQASSAAGLSLSLSFVCCVCVFVCVCVFACVCVCVCVCVCHNSTHTQETLSPGLTAHIVRP